MLSQGDLAEVIRIIVAARLLETGKWEEETKRLSDAAKALAEQQAIVKTLAEAKQVEAKAVKKFYDAEAKAHEPMEAVKREQAALKKREEAFTAAQVEFKRTSDEKNRLLAELSGELGRREKAIVADEVALTARVAAAARKDSSLEVRENALREGEKTLAERVARIKAAAL